MKKTKVIIPALGILLLSTAASVTGTVAWFTSSNAVSASGINVKIEKEEGFVISNEALAAWGVSALASHDGKIGENQAEFVPTSSADATTWAHAQAEKQDKSNALAGTYVMMTPAQNASTGVFTGTIAEGVNKNIYLLNNFYIKASTTSDLTNKPLYAKVSASGNTSNPALDKALRVIVRYGIGSAVNNNTSWEYAGTTVFAPFRADTDGEELSYTVCKGVTDGAPSATANVTAIPSGTAAQLATSVTIPANNLTNLAVNKFQVQVYAFFEGEDVACYSDNIGATLDTLAISVGIGTTDAL